MSAYLQIIHSRENDFIVATNIGCAPRLKVFDSLYSSVDETTIKLLTNLFGLSIIEMGDILQQVRVTDCGVYTIATSVALANNMYPGKFVQQSMRAHLHVHVVVF